MLVGAVDEDVGPSGALQLELGAFTGGSDGDGDGKQVNEVSVEVTVKKNQVTISIISWDIMQG